MVAEPGGGTYTFGICGTTGTDPRFDPSAVLGEPTAQAIVRLLNGGPRTAADLASQVPPLALAIQRDSGPRQAPAQVQEPLPFEEALRRVAALRAAEEGDGLWRISFPLLTAADQELLRRNLIPFAASLAEQFLASGHFLEEALREVPWARPAPEVRLAVVGCFVLDWAGLALLGRLGLTTPGPTYPDGGQFTIMGRERGGGMETRLYCSSHTSRGKTYSFTSFGDNAGPRRGLPDVLWLCERAVGGRSDLPEDLRRALVRLARAQAEEALDRAGASLAAGAQGSGGQEAEPAAALLSALGHVRGGRPGIELFRATHWPALRRAMEEGLRVLRHWLSEHAGGLERATAGTSPASNGVDTRMLFVDVWHEAFGAANRILGERGWLLDPDPPGPGEARYISWCAESALYDELYRWALSITA
jgi:hypothetical protein